MLFLNYYYMNNYNKADYFLQLCFTKIISTTSTFIQIKCVDYEFQIKILGRVKK